MVFTVVILTLLVYITHVVAGAVITCDAPSVRKGEPANITCNFNEDVSITKKNIKVQHRPYGSTSFNVDDVTNILDCYWLNADDFNCNRAEGFEVIGKVGKTATLKLSNAQTKNEGKYTCEVVPSDPINIQACDFHLTIDDPAGIIISVPGQDQKPISDVDNLVRVVLAFVVATFIAVVINLVVIGLLNRQQITELLQKCVPPKAKKEDAKKVDIELQQPTEETSPRDETTENDSLLVTEVHEGETTGAAATKDQGAEIEAGDESAPVHIQIRMSVAKDLKLSLKDKINRAKEEVEMKIKEDDAREQLEEITRENDEARRQQKEDDQNNKKNEGNLDKKERERRRTEDRDRTEKQDNADEKLKKIMRENSEKRQKLKDQDLEKLRKAKR